MKKFYNVDKIFPSTANFVSTIGAPFSDVIVEIEKNALILYGFKALKGSQVAHHIVFHNQIC